MSIDDADPYAHERLRERILRFTLAQHATKAEIDRLGLRYDADHAVVRLWQRSLPALYVAEREYAETFGLKLEVKITPEAEIPSFHKIEQWLDAEDRRHRRLHVQAARKHLDGMRSELACARRHGPLVGYASDLECNVRAYEDYLSTKKTSSRTAAARVHAGPRRRSPRTQATRSCAASGDGPADDPDPPPPVRPRPASARVFFVPAVEQQVAR